MSINRSTVRRAYFWAIIQLHCNEKHWFQAAEIPHPTDDMLGRTIAHDDVLLTVTKFNTI